MKTNKAKKNVESGMYMGNLNDTKKWSLVLVVIA